MSRLVMNCRRSISVGLLFSFYLLVALVVACPLLHAAPPAWWTTRGVIDANKQANDYAAVNQGQLKNIATAALAEMDEAFTAANLPVDLNDTFHLQVNSWLQPSATRNDYEAVNLGQLKNIALPFYDRFKAVYYTDRYPWTGSATPANDYATANIGQVKNLFSFDFTQPGAGLDLDGNGLPDYWEMKYYGHTGVNPYAAFGPNTTLTNMQAYQQSLNSTDYYSGSAPTLTIVSGTPQTGRPTEYVPAPLGVSVTDSHKNILVGAPVTFTVSQGGGSLQSATNGLPSTVITVYTDNTGLAKVLFRLPNVPNNTSLISATPNGVTYPSPRTFTESTDSESDPHDPTNVVATMNSDGSGDVSWTNNADPSDTESIDIMYKDKNGTWQILQNVPAGTTSYHIPAP